MGAGRAISVLEQDSTSPGLDHSQGALFGNPQFGDAKT